MNKYPTVDFGNMKDYEIEAFHTIMMSITGRHFTKAAVDYIKRFLEVHTIIDSKEVIPAPLIREGDGQYFDYCALRPDLFTIIEKEIK